MSRMMMCSDCLAVFPEDEVRTWKEDTGEIFAGCPYCGSPFDEAEECDECEEYFHPDDLSGGVCVECLKKAAKDFDLCWKIGKDEKADCKISEVLMVLFTDEEVEEILVDYVKEKMPGVDCSDFVFSDASWFGDKWREVKKSEEKR